MRLSLVFHVLFAIDLGLMLQLPAIAQHAGTPRGWVDPPQNVEFVDYAMQWSQAERSLVDLSGFLEKPAGKAGFVRAKDGHLYDPRGRRFRIWGINMGAEDCYPPKELAPDIAGDLARLGFNYVRMHHMDAGFGPVSVFKDGADNTRSLDPERLDRLDFFVAELKKRGVYTNFNLNNSRSFRPADGVRDRKPLGVGKTATYFNPRLIELQHEYARLLLDRVNPYTGNHYRDEPALIAVEMVNENSLIEGWIMDRIHCPNADGRAMFGSLPESYGVELTVQFNQWLAAQGDEKFIDRLREESGVKPGQLIPRLRAPEFATASQERFRTEAEFYMHLEDTFFTDFKQLLRDELGIKSMLVGPADHNDGAAMFPHLKTLAKHFDFIDGHGYWEHPQLEKPHWVRNSPMVNDPLDSSYNQFTRSPVLGVPFVVGETSGPYPGDYSAETFPILTAYACLQDWDGVCWFYYGKGRKEGDDAGIGDFFALGNDPSRMASIAASASMFHRQDVSAAKTTVIRAYDASSLIESMRMDRASSRPFFTSGYSLPTALSHAVRLTFDPSCATALPDITSNDDYVSDTGQLRWRQAQQKRGVVSINTPKTQALIGFIGDTPSDLPHLKAHLDNPFATIVLTSLDDQRLETARKMLLFAGNRVQNTGLAFERDHQTIVTLGQRPTQIERMRGTVTVAGLEGAARVTLTPLQAIGAPQGEPLSLPVTSHGDIQITLDRVPTVWWLIERE